MRIIILSISLFLIISCNKTNGNLQKTNDVDLEYSTNMGSKVEPIFFLNFDDSIIRNEYIKKDTSLASSVFFLNVPLNQNIDNNVLVSAVQNSGNNITAKAKLSIENPLFFKNKKWFSFKFLIPEYFKVETINQGKELIIFQIKKNRTNENAIMVQFTHIDTLVYLSIRYGKERRLICVREIKKGVWNKLILNVNFEQNKYGYIESWLNGESFTPETGFTNKYYGKIYNAEDDLTLLIGQQRNWADKNPSIIYFDDLSIGNDYKSPNGENYLFEQENNFDIYK